jgi:hypothetical protein
MSLYQYLPVLLAYRPHPLKTEGEFIRRYRLLQGGTWVDYVRVIEPVLKDHPEWTVGEAEAYLRQQGIDLAPILGEREPEEVV